MLCDKKLRFEFKVKFNPISVRQAVLYVHGTKNLVLDIIDVANMITISQISYVNYIE